jgi:hypothetical protein
MQSQAHGFIHASCTPNPEAINIFVILLGVTRVVSLSRHALLEIFSTF